MLDFYQKVQSALIGNDCRLIPVPLIKGHPQMQRISASEDA